LDIKIELLPASSPIKKKLKFIRNTRVCTLSEGNHGELEILVHLQSGAEYATELNRHIK
jgi:hypothetical protein